jgi:hypothetical protein
MSGFSAVVGGLSSGLGQGMVNYSKGQDDQAQYEALMAKKKREETVGKQQETINDQIIQSQQLKLEGLKDNALKQSVTFVKNKVAETMTNFADTYSSVQGKMATIDEEGNKTYSVPKDLEEDIQDLNRYVVHDNEGANWINHFLDGKYGTMKNPVVNTKYEPESDQIVLVQQNGKEIKMAPLMLNNALGLNKYQSIKTNKQMERIAQQSELKYKQNKALVEERKATTELLKQRNSNLKLQSDLKVNEEKLKEGKDKEFLSETHKISKQVLDNPETTQSTAKIVVDSLMSDKKFTDGLTKNALYTKVSDLKFFADKTGDMSAELNALAEGARTGTADSVNKLAIRYTGKGIDKEEFLKAKSLTTRMNLLVMDYLQYKSGAAFGAEELKGYQDAGGIMDFTDPDLAKQSLEGMTTYLQDKLARNIEQVPNANERLVLKYQNKGFEPKVETTKQETKVEKMPEFATTEEAVAYLKELKKTNPELYEKYKSEALGGN